MSSPTRRSRSGAATISLTKPAASASSAVRFSAALIAELASRDADLVLPADPRPQPLAARYGPALVEPLRAGLATGGPLTRIATELGPEVIATAELRRYGDPAVMFSNVNDRDDLARIEARLSGQSGTSSTRAL